MLCITILVSVALFNHVNGVTLALGISAVTGIAGYAIGVVKKS